MKSLFDDDQLAPNVSHDAPTSHQSINGQEIGSNGDVVITNTAFPCFLLRMDLTLARRVCAEALGTFILVFCICGIIATMHIMGIHVGLMEYAVTAALTVIVVVFSIGSISGAHVNPAITIAFATVGGFPLSKVPFYVLAQIGGSILAAYVGKLVYGVKSELMITRPLRGCTSAFWVEFISTFILLFVSTAMLKEAKSVGKLSGLVAGVAIGLGVLITGPVSGGSMNPARSLGPAIVSWKFEGIWVYLTAPTIGAIIGVLLFRVLCLQPKATGSTSPNPNLLSHS